jgi:hypothetical protein
LKEFPRFVLTVLFYYRITFNKSLKRVSNIKRKEKREKRKEKRKEKGKRNRASPTRISSYTLLQKNKKIPLWDTFFHFYFVSLYAAFL